MVCSAFRGSSFATWPLVRRRMKGRSALAKQLPCLLVGLAAGASRSKTDALPSMPGIEELEQAPQLAQMILDRRAAQRQAMVGLEQAHGLGRLRWRRS